MYVIKDNASRDYFKGFTLSPGGYKSASWACGQKNAERFATKEAAKEAMMFWGLMPWLDLRIVRLKEKVNKKSCYCEMQGNSRDCPTHNDWANKMARSYKIAGEDTVETLADLLRRVQILEREGRLI